MASGEAGPANEPEWRRLNRANWDERAAIHLGPRGYDLMHLRAGRGRLPIVEAELGAVAGLRVLHLQCHIGTDSLALAQRGAEVVGVDFSAAAITAARDLAGELGLADRARFVGNHPLAVYKPAARLWAVRHAPETFDYSLRYGDDPALRF